MVDRFTLMVTQKSIFGLNVRNFEVWYLRDIFEWSNIGTPHVQFIYIFFDDIHYHLSL